MKLLVTGGAGFIGSNFIRYWLKSHPSDDIVSLDLLTYAGHLSSTTDFSQNPHYVFIQGDICNVADVQKALEGVDTIVHFAAESHVDRSILDPLLFVKTNVLGTANLLHLALKKGIKRFHHVSTDEVFGHLGTHDLAFNENTPYQPRTPYAASKAGADHLVRSFYTTYGMPVTITNCANNFGPFHDPEKLIPRFIINLMLGKKVPLMGSGDNIREWLYVDDHARAIELVLEKGVVGETYCVGGEAKTNLEVTKLILEILGQDESMIEYVSDRLGHDFRYAIDCQKIKDLGWNAQYSFQKYLENVVNWYQQNEDWWKPLLPNRPVVDAVVQEKFK